MSGSTSKTWNGGPGNFVIGDFFDLNNWHFADGSAGTPPQFSPGDTGEIDSGTATVTGATVEGLNIILRTSDRSPSTASPGTLKLRNAVLDTNTTVDQPGGSSFGTIEAQDIAVNQGAIVVDSPVGPGDLTIQIDPRSLFANTGTISVNSGALGEGAALLRIQGSAHSLFLNDGNIGIDGSNAVVTAPVKGNGTFTLTSQSPSNAPGALEFGRAVGAGQDIVFADTADAGSSAITAATLQLDKPMRFAATITGFNTPDRIELANMSVSGAYYTPTDANSGDLVLLSQCNVVADLHLATGPSISTNYTTQDFTISNSGGNAFIGLASHLAPPAMVASIS